ncbi:hypothetical protein GGX14DRAFT_565001 [Mycena pura]|uniref:Uncharacterized protein n=1 Tax=Mycena pura TaxID=153505 RepID=A0AAD6VFX0_9AGAR|nr:hypothetical protein GGX14DRAFT_565001 [Mycena pura]
MSPPVTNLAGLALGGFAYGIYLMLFAISMFVGIQAPHATPFFRSPVFMLAIALFVGVSGNFALTIARPFQGFIFYRDGTAPAEFFNDNTQPTTAIQNVFFAFSLLMADAMIVRVRRARALRLPRVVVVPILSLIGVVIASVITIDTTVHVTDIALDKLVTPGLVFTLVTNLYSTSFISYKIWKITRKSAPLNGTNLNNLISLLIESAAMYTAWTVFYIITHQINSDAQFVALIDLPPIAGIANALIQVRMGLGKAVEMSRAGATGAGTGASTAADTHSRLGAGIQFVVRPGTASTASAMDGSRRKAPARNASDVIELKPATLQ